MDVGGTKTHLRAEDAEGTVLHDDVLPTGAWRGLDDSAKAALISARIASANLTQIDALVVGAHGADDDDAAAALEQQVRLLLGAKTRVLNDACLLGPAAGRPDAVGLVVGTGSIAVGIDRDRTRLYVGGWGWLVGDDGGAAGLVRTAVREVLRAEDEQRRDPLLAAALCAAARVSAPGELWKAMLRESHASWAGWAPALTAAADAGSPLAGEVIDRGIDELVRLVRVVGERGGDVASVVAAGGVVVNAPSITRLLRSALNEIGSELIVLDRAPVIGAVALARELFATPAGQEVR
jgi:N-acetylglucosamine kinase-like BadF-type ATPase